MAVLQGTKRVWKDESEFKNKADAELVQQELDYIASQDANGKCKNEDIVAYGMTKAKSEIGKCLEKNDKVAANKYRLHQASRIKDGIRTIVITNAVEKIEHEEPQVFEVVTNHSLPTKGEGHKNIEIILKDQADTLALEQEMYNFLRQYARSFRTRFALAPNASTYIKMLDDIVAQIP